MENALCLGFGVRKCESRRSTFVHCESMRRFKTLSRDARVGRRGVKHVREWEMHTQESVAGGLGHFGRRWAKSGSRKKFLRIYYLFYNLIVSI